MMLEIFLVWTDPQFDTSPILQIITTETVYWKAKVDTIGLICILDMQRSLFFDWYRLNETSYDKRYI